MSVRIESARCQLELSQPHTRPGAAAWWELYRPVGNGLDRSNHLPDTAETDHVTPAAAAALRTLPDAVPSPNSSCMAPKWPPTPGPNRAVESALHSGA